MAMREYRKGNWTVEETMILIEAKKKDDERRKLNRSKQITVITTSPSSSGSGNSSKPVAELRWKWVEEYCWGKGCFRSQNQCNDKWDNLMRDYKKVRDYQKTLNPNFNNNTSQQPTTSNIKSYWSMDKIERKEKGLPTNMLPQIYQALFDVVETTATTTTVTTSFLPPSPLPVRPALQISPPPSSLPIPPPSQPQRSPALEAEKTSEQDSQDPELSPAKRRKKGGGNTMAASSTTEAVNTAISKSATKISDVIHASEEKQERRHKEMMTMHESRLRVEESMLEINRQGLNGLTDAINRLATSIFYLG